jgi:hypothetical protein
LRVYILVRDWQKRAGCVSKLIRAGEEKMKIEEIQKLDAYFKRTFNNPALKVKARPRKDDSCELYLGDEFLGIIFKDEEEGELSYNFSMAILEADLD